jgi:hypothetical protein
MILGCQLACVLIGQIQVAMEPIRNPPFGFGQFFYKYLLKVHVKTLPFDLAPAPRRKTYVAPAPAATPILFSCTQPFKN